MLELSDLDVRDETSVKQWLESVPAMPRFEWFERLKPISMLSTETLALLHAFAAKSEGAILEIGPFVGGSTVALASAGRDVISIEVGGRSEHPVVGTDDILRDLRRNIAAYGLSEKVTLLPMWASEAYWRLPSVLDGRKIGMIFIDADGHVLQHVSHLQKHMTDDCLIVLDDYSEEEKGAGVRHFIEVAGKSIGKSALIVNSTWFGYRRMKKLPSEFFLHRAGNCWIANIPVSFGIPDCLDKMSASQTRLFEDGREIGPAHVIHTEIEKFGRGSFSHWKDGFFYFSSSDNSDPNKNGRLYEIDAGRGRLALNDPVRNRFSSFLRKRSRS